MDDATTVKLILKQYQPVEQNIRKADGTLLPNISLEKLQVLLPNLCTHYGGEFLVVTLPRGRINNHFAEKLRTDPDFTGASIIHVKN